MGKIEWMDCPLCGESDMKAEYHDHNDVDPLPPIITCTNHGCPSNTGNLIDWLLQTSCDNQYLISCKLAANVGYDLVEQRYDDIQEQKPTTFIRDQFAMAALTGILADNDNREQGVHNTHIAKAAYSMADAMMKERSND